MMVQRYKIFILFILSLNYLAFSCANGRSGRPGEENANNKKQEMQKIDIGSKAPLVTLPDQQGKLVNLNDLVGKTSLVIFFYPKDESYGCTKEACSFRDSYEDFKEAGAEVIGISSDDVSSHQSFAAKHKLPFILLSDKDKKASALYGVGTTLGVLPGRVTFVIDKQGIVRMKFSSQLNFQKHISEALEIVKKIG